MAIGEVSEWWEVDGRFTEIQTFLLLPVPATSNV
jgi:hypothetical protein